MRLIGGQSTRHPQRILCLIRVLLYAWVLVLKNCGVDWCGNKTGAGKLDNSVSAFAAAATAATVAADVRATNTVFHVNVWARWLQGSKADKLLLLDGAVLSGHSPHRFWLADAASPPSRRFKLVRRIIFETPASFGGRVNAKCDKSSRKANQAFASGTCTPQGASGTRFA